jgi:hypothetical protein
LLSTGRGGPDFITTVKLVIVQCGKKSKSIHFPNISKNKQKMWEQSRK